MRRLLLLRHAKAERSQPGGRDHERVLAERGRDDARNSGAYMVRHSFVPDRALVSTSARTRETWELVGHGFRQAPRRPEFDGRIYEASPEAILQLDQGDRHRRSARCSWSATIPACSELAAMLVASGDVEARQRLRRIPDLGAGGDQLRRRSWDGLHAEGGRLEHFVTPDTAANPRPTSVTRKECTDVSRILVPVDLADPNLAKPALETAVMLAKATDGDIRLINVLPVTPAHAGRIRAGRFRRAAAPFGGGSADDHRRRSRARRRASVTRRCARAAPIRRSWKRRRRSTPTSS